MTGAATANKNGTIKFYEKKMTKEFSIFLGSDDQPGVSTTLKIWSWQDPQHPMCPRKIKYDPAVVSWQPLKKCRLKWRWHLRTWRCITVSPRFSFILETMADLVRWFTD